jgi:large subunit ribosomal protein L23
MESNTQYTFNTFNVESGFTKTEIKHWVELFFGVKVVAVNSHRLPGKGRRMGPILGHTMHYRRMIITLQPGYSIPLLLFKLKGILKQVFLSFSQSLSFESNLKFD